MSDSISRYPQNKVKGGGETVPSQPQNPLAYLNTGFNPLSTRQLGRFIPHKLP